MKKINKQKKQKKITKEKITKKPFLEGWPSRGEEGATLVRLLVESYAIF